MFLCVTQFFLIYAYHVNVYECIHVCISMDLPIGLVPALPRDLPRLLLLHQPLCGQSWAAQFMDALRLLFHDILRVAVFCCGIAHASACFRATGLDYQTTGWLYLLSFFFSLSKIPCSTDTRAWHRFRCSFPFSRPVLSFWSCLRQSWCSCCRGRSHSEA